MNKLISRGLKIIVSNVSNECFSYSDEIFDPKKGQTISRWVLLLPGSGCIWARLHGGCYMCGFKYKINEVMKGKPSSHQYLMKLFRLGELLVSETSHKNLTVYNGGSFLNDAEIPFQTQLEICHRVGRHPTIEKLFVESRPEFVTQEKIQSLNAPLREKKLEVGIGLECASDDIRNQCIHKGFLRKDYEKAVRILKQNGAEILTYVFLKPIHLTEREAIEEAIQTIKYAFQIGSDEVALEAAFIQKGTIMEALYSNGEYRPPWLWSILEVVRNTHHLGPVRIGGFKDEPPPIDVPRNCSKCSPSIMTLLGEYKKTLRVQLFDDLKCECRLEWEKELV